MDEDLPEDREEVRRSTDNHWSRRTRCRLRELSTFIRLSMALGGVFGLDVVKRTPHFPHLHPR